MLPGKGHDLVWPCFEVFHSEAFPIIERWSCLTLSLFLWRISPFLGKLSLLDKRKAIRLSDSSCFYSWSIKLGHFWPLWCQVLNSRWLDEVGEKWEPRFRFPPPLFLWLLHIPLIPLMSWGIKVLFPLVCKRSWRCIQCGKLQCLRSTLVMSGVRQNRAQILAMWSWACYSKSVRAPVFSSVEWV